MKQIHLLLILEEIINDSGTVKNYQLKLKLKINKWLIDELLDKVTLEDKKALEIFKSD